MSGGFNGAQNKHRVLHTPLCDEETADLRTGDVVYLDGIVVTGRDDVHRRIARENMDCPVDLKGGAIFHAGPIVRENPPVYEVISVGPTSSIRMEEYAARFIAKTGIKMMIGKGGMGEKTAAACRDYRAVHCVYPGGCAVLGAEQVEQIEGVFWRELGMPECMWVLRVRELGPLIVSIDSRGDNLFSHNAECYAGRGEKRMAPIIEQVKEFL